MITAEASGSARRRRSGTGAVRLGLVGALLLATATTAGGVVAASSSAVAQAAAPETAAVVPETALVYVAANLDLESTQWGQVETLLARVGYPTAVETARRAIDEELAADPSTAAIAIDDLLGGELGIVVGEPAVAALMTTAADEVISPAPPFDSAGVATPAVEATPAAAPSFGPAGGIALVLSADDPAAAFAVFDRELREEAAEAGVEAREIDYRGTEIVARAAGSAFADGSAVAVVDDLVLFAETPADLEPLIDTAAGDAAPLTDFGPMTGALEALPDETALFGFVNGERIGDALAGLGVDPDQLDDALEAISPDAADAVSLDFHAGFALWADDPGLRFDTIVLPTPGGTLPPAPANTETTVDERVTADALFFASGNDLGADGSLDIVALALAAALTEGLVETTDATPVAGMVDDLSPEAIEEQFAAAERILGFDLRADLFDQPVGEYALALSAGDVFRGEGFGFVFASGVAEPPVVAATLRRIARLIESAGGGMVDVTTRQVEGETVFETRLRATDEVTVTSPPLEFGVVGEEVVVGFGSGLDDYASGPAAALADDPQYRRVMATLPTEHNQVSYLDLRFIASPLGALFGAIDFSGAEGEPRDADAACGAFDDQSEAQAAYDEDPIANGELDVNFDDRACEDFFGDAAAGVAATPVGGEVAADADLSAVRALASVSYSEGENRRSSTILYIAEEGAADAATPAP